MDSSGTRFGTDLPRIFVLVCPDRQQQNKRRLLSLCHGGTFI
jgi:hypothetical protein